MPNPEPQTDESEYVTETGEVSATLWKIACVTMLGSFMSQLDSTLVNVSLDSLSHDLHASLATIQWVISGYLLALTLALPLNGWLVSRLGTKSVYIACFMAFTLTSALCGLAWSANSLIGFRILQGMSGGLLAPMAQTVIARAAGKNLARVVGYISVPVLLAPVFGPVVAGSILHFASWRWLFLINIPIGIVAIALAFRFLPNAPQETTKSPLDWLGLALLSPGLVMFLYAAGQISTPSGQIILSVSLLLIAAFVFNARKKRQRALIDIALFRNKTFSVAAITQFLTNGVIFSGQMLIPLFLIRLGGFSPTEMGWMMLPQGLGMMCANPLMGMLTQRFGTRYVSAGGALLSLLGCLPFILMAAEGIPVPVLACSLFIRGAGLSATGIPSMAAAYRSVERNVLPMATTTLNISQRIGGPTLTTLCALFLQWQIDLQTHITPSSRPYLSAFILLSVLHSLIIISAIRLPKRKD
jgi:EmrB/QacA subfamily drug resistance transporter